MFTLPITASIPATKSHELRSVYFTRNWDADQPHDGTLQVVESVGKRKPRLITETYLIQEEPPIGFMGRQFLVAKDSTSGWEGTVRGHDAQERVGNVYECRVFCNGEGTCNCTAGETKSGPCVHFLALRELITTGGLESPLEFGQPSPVFDEDQDAEIVDDFEDRPFPPEPTYYEPGSDKRVAIEAERMEAGFKPWHPMDIDF